MPLWMSVATVGSLCAVAALVLTNAPAGAMGGGNPAAIMARAENPPPERATNQGNFETEVHTRLRYNPAPARTHANINGVAVCVRLCDGFFFPSNSSLGSEDACVAQCPDAPTALYRESVGSDRIEDAVSRSGAPYSALPAAGRYRESFDNTCTCHRQTVNYSAMLLHDSTLQKGDVVMTPSGPVVYEGAQTATPSRKDFVALAKDSTLPRETRAELSTMRSAPWAKQLAADRIETQ